MKKINLNEYKEKIENLYFNEKFSLKKIAREIGVCAGTIRKNMVLWGMERRNSRKRKLIKPSKEELEKFYINKKLLMDKIAKNLDVSLGTIFRWLNDYNISPARRFKYKKYDFSEDPKEKAYILGLVMGDLYVRKYYRQILVELSTTHPAMADLFYSVFQKYGMVKKYLKYNKITKRYGRRLYIYLNNSFNFVLSKNFDIDNEYFYDFLAGFFDSEGCLHVYNNHEYIGLSLLIYNSNKKLLEVIKSRLEKEGFNPKFSIFIKRGRITKEGYYSNKDIWAIRLHTNKEVQSLMNKMLIKHKEKTDKFNIAMSINNKRWKDISEEFNKLKVNIKDRAKEFINPHNERSNVL